MGLRKRDSFRIVGYTASEADPVEQGEAQPSWFKCPHLRSRQAPPRPCRGRPPRSRAASGGHRGIVFRFGVADGFYNFKFGFIGGLGVFSWLPPGGSLFLTAFSLQTQIYISKTNINPIFEILSLSFPSVRSE